MGFDGELVGVLPGDVEPLCDDLAGEAHVLVVEDVPESVMDHGVHRGLVVHPESPPCSGEQVGCLGHALHASDGEDVVLARFDGVGSEHGRFESGTAYCVDCE